MSRLLYIERNQNIPGSPVEFISSYTEYGLYNTTVNMNFTVPAEATVLIVAIRCVNLSNRVATAPTWNGVAMTEAGSYAGLGAYSEIWYLNSPASGSHTLSIPNGTGSNLQVTASWYSCNNPLTVHSTAISSGNSSTPSVTLAIGMNKNLLVIDALTVRNSATGHLEFTNSHTRIWTGLGGASFGSGCQYSIFLSSASSITMSYTIAVTKIWQQLIVSFQNQ